MFHYDDGLRLTAIDLAIDVRRRCPRGFISHAHADHMAPHELAFCTPATAALYQFRLGQRLVRAMPFHEPLAWDDFQLICYPAGHVLGSAMLWASDGSTSLLYTGDFKLSPSATAEPAEPPHADVLIMESTFGDPRYRLPPREQSVRELTSVVRQAFEIGATPIIHAYSLGKAQEVTKLLTSQGLAVAQHPLIFPISQLYERLGCPLGNFQLFTGGDEFPRDRPLAVIAPPRGQRAATVDVPGRTISIAVTGWAQDPRAKFRMGVDYAIPLSDHADFDELCACVERVAPRKIYCTHGPVEFVDQLRDRGWNAFPLAKEYQQRLFR